MKMFGLEITGWQSLHVKCPKCGKLAQLHFFPSKDNVAIPLTKELSEVLHEANLSDFTSIPTYDDMHFICLSGGHLIRYCEVMKKACLLKPMLEVKEAKL